MANNTEDLNSKPWVYLYTEYYEIVFKLEANQIKIHPEEARGEFDMMHKNVAKRYSILLLMNSDSIGIFIKICQNSKNFKVWNDMREATD